MHRPQPIERAQDAQVARVGVGRALARLRLARPLAPLDVALEVEVDRRHAVAETIAEGTTRTRCRRGSLPLVGRPLQPPAPAPVAGAAHWPGLLLRWCCRVEAVSAVRDRRARSSCAALETPWHRRHSHAAPARTPAPESSSSSTPPPRWRSRAGGGECQSGGRIWALLLVDPAAGAARGDVVRVAQLLHHELLDACPPMSGTDTLTSPLNSRRSACRRRAA